MLLSLLFLSGAIDAASSSAAKGAFREYCDPTSISISNAQARWHCTDRGYESLADLHQTLAERNPRSRWASPFWREDEPVLAKLQGKETFWDCLPGEDLCGIWVKLAPKHLVFIQQLLDRERNNAWLGIGLTVFCEGTEASCQAVQDQVAGLLPSGDLAETSLVGSPPVAPPLPPSP
ncbi:MAG: hypothetical protein IPK97_01625 [Ahniella sp.]|nr:hypothetical protein [Ahniella sp.]